MINHPPLDTSTVVDVIMELVAPVSLLETSFVTEMEESVDQRGLSLMDSLSWFFVAEEIVIENSDESKP